MGPEVLRPADSEVGKLFAFISKRIGFIFYTGLIFVYKACFRPVKKKKIYAIMISIGERKSAQKKIFVTQNFHQFTHHRMTKS